MTGPAALILVVGPSGAGKDTLIDGAREALSDDPGLCFARRVVTRPAQPGAEDHDSLTPEEFAAAARDGAFLLSWRAHGLDYGIPASLQELRRDGIAVVANVSRAVVEDARRRLGPVRVVVVTAPPEVLAKRLAGRGRESADDILARLRRAQDAFPTGPDVAIIVNDASAEEGIRAFLAVIRSFRNGGMVDGEGSRRHMAEEGRA
jgi:phosphonate metabolism protein PhnN/1,5-bisphosphokinase (PRPP-forming)